MKLREIVPPGWKAVIVSGGRISRLAGPGMYSCFPARASRTSSK